MNLEGRLTRLRAVEPDDVELMYAWENDSSVWPVSGTTEPFSHRQMEAFVERQQAGDIFRTGQLRLIIEAREEASASDEPAAGRSGAMRPVGAVDLFDFDPLHGRAGIGILIHAADDRGRGYAADALQTLCRYACRTLRLHQLWCDVGSTNTASLRLFRAAGFREIGVKRDWQWTPDGFRDEILMQKLLE